MYSVPDPPFIREALPHITPEHRTWLTVRDDDYYSFRWTGRQWHYRLELRLAKVGVRMSFVWIKCRLGGRGRDSRNFCRADWCATHLRMRRLRNLDWRPTSDARQHPCPAPSKKPHRAMGRIGIQHHLRRTGSVGTVARRRSIWRWLALDPGLSRQSLSLHRRANWAS
jgi:hypothetical protein